MLTNQTAVITGCSRGIGRAILEVFAQNHCSVWACARTHSESFLADCSDLEAQYGTKVTPIPLDLSDEGSIKTSAQKIMSEKLPVNILINNAGVLKTALFQMTTRKQLDEMMAINYTSQLQLSQYIIKNMIKCGGGSIVNISSSSGLDGNQGRISYSASKAALISATKVMAKELGGYNIRVNAVAPGLVETDMMRDNTAEEAIGQTLLQTCLKRTARPDEVAQAVLFLASGMSSYITGQTLRVDGGMYSVG